MRDLLSVLREQRQYFIRKTTGERMITNPLLYNSLEEEALQIQIKYGRENKRKIIAECKKKGIPIPNFSRGNL